MSVRKRNRRDPKTGAVKKVWMIDVVYEHPNGREERIRKVSPVQTLRGAEAYERQVRAALLEPDKEAPREVPTLASFERDFIAYAITNNKPSEVETKKGTMKNHIIPAFGRMRMNEIGPRDIERFKAAKISEGLSPKSVNNYLTCLRKLLSVAVDFGHLDHIPAVKWLRVPPNRFDFLNFEEAGRVLAGAEEGIWRTMILTAMKTGLRLGELLALRWEDVDLVAGRLMVNRSYTRKVFTTPKNGRTRELPLGDDVLAALKAFRHLKGELIFSKPDGKPLAKGETKHPLWRACKKAGLRRIGWHSLRHTFASHLVMRGAPMKAVQELLGHSTMEMTMRYSHLSPDVRKDAVRLLDAQSYGTIAAPRDGAARNAAN